MSHPGSGTWHPGPLEDTLHHPGQPFRPQQRLTRPVLGGPGREPCCSQRSARMCDPAPERGGHVASYREAGPGHLSPTVRCIQTTRGSCSNVDPEAGVWREIREPAFLALPRRRLGCRSACCHPLSRSVTAMIPAWCVLRCPAESPCPARSSPHPNRSSLSPPRAPWACRVPLEETAAKACGYVCSHRPPWAGGLLIRARVLGGGSGGVVGLR